MERNKKGEPHVAHVTKQLLISTSPFPIPLVPSNLPPSPWLLIRRSRHTQALPLYPYTTFPMYNASPVQRFPCTTLPLVREPEDNIYRPFKFKTLPPFPRVAVLPLVLVGGPSFSWGTPYHPNGVPLLLLKQSSPNISVSRCSREPNDRTPL